MTETVESTITFPYKRSLGPVLGAFMTALTEQRLIGIRNGDHVMCPPLEWDPRTGAELAHDFVEVGPVGTVETWCWVANPTTQHPLGRPFAFAAIRLDGADTALVHVVDAGTAKAMSIGMRVAPRWRSERKGHITDIEAFVPGEQPRGRGGGGAAEPSWYEPMWLEAHHLTGPGDGWKMVEDGTTALGGSFPVNMSGGVLSSNPIGASGLLRFAEAALQVRGTAGEHQVDGARVALAQAYGASAQYFSMWVVASSPDPFGGS